MTKKQYYRLYASMLVFIVVLVCSVGLFANATTITTIQTTDTVEEFRVYANQNFANLNTYKMEISTSSLSYGDVVLWGGSDWTTLATSSLGIAGGGTVATGTANSIGIYTSTGTTITGTSSIVVLPNGNVGIGSTTPSSRLVVDDNSSATSTMQVGDSDHGTNKGRHCLWNGANFTIIQFPENSITPEYSTSTTCNL